MPKSRKNPAQTAARPRAAHLAILVLAALGFAAIYLPTLRYQFVWDDEQLVTANQRLETRSPLALLGQNFMPLRHGSLATRVQYYRPLTVFTFWLDRHVWGLNPFGYHLTNVLLNALAVVLLAFLLRAAGAAEGETRSASPGGPWDTIPIARTQLGYVPRHVRVPRRLWPVLLGLAVFSLHPAHVESVAFISGRTDVLATVFILACLLCLLRYVGGGRWFWLGAAFASSAAALLSKEVAVLLPLVGFAMLYRPAPVPRKRALTVVAVLAATALGYLVVRSFVLGSAGLAAGHESMGQRLLLFLNAFGRYGRVAVFPFAHRLVYPDRAAFAAFGWPTLAGGFLLVLLAWLGWRFRRSTSGLGAVWFLAFIVPASNLFSIGATFLAERLLYLPLAGAAIMVMAGERLRSGIRRNAFVVVLSAYAVFLAAGSLGRMPVWRDPVTLFRTMVRESPNSADAHLNLGAALLKQEGDTLQAEAEFRSALAIRPDHPVAHNDLGDVLRKQGKVAEAEQEYRAAVSLDSGYAEAHGNLGIVLFQTGRTGSAFEQFRRARSLDPTLAPVYVNIGNCFVERNQPDSAKLSFWTAIRLQPGLSAAYVNLSRLYAALGKPDSAELVNRMLAARPGAWPRAVR